MTFDISVYLESVQIQITLSLTQIVFVMSQKLGSDPHVAELGHEQTEAFTRKIELMTTPALFFKENGAVHVNEHDEQTKREV